MHVSKERSGIVLSAILAPLGRHWRIFCGGACQNGYICVLALLNHLPRCVWNDYSVECGRREISKSHLSCYVENCLCWLLLQARKIGTMCRFQYFLKCLVCMDRCGEGIVKCCGLHARSGEEPFSHWGYYMGRHTASPRGLSCNHNTAGIASK